MSVEIISKQLAINFIVILLSLHLSRESQFRRLRCPSPTVLCKVRRRIHSAKRPCLPEARFLPKPAKGNFTIHPFPVLIITPAIPAATYGVYQFFYSTCTPPKFKSSECCVVVEYISPALSPRPHDSSEMSPAPVRLVARPCKPLGAQLVRPQSQPASPSTRDHRASRVIERARCRIIMAPRPRQEIPS